MTLFIFTVDIIFAFILGYLVAVTLKQKKVGSVLDSIKKRLDYLEELRKKLEVNQLSEDEKLEYLKEVYSLEGELKIINLLK